MGVKSNLSWQSSGELSEQNKMTQGKGMSKHVRCPTQVQWPQRGCRFVEKEAQKWGTRKHRRFYNESRKHPGVWLLVPGIDWRLTDQTSLQFWDDCAAENTMSLDQNILRLLETYKQSYSPQAFQNRKWASKAVLLWGQHTTKILSLYGCA